MANNSMVSVIVDETQFYEVDNFELDDAPVYSGDPIMLKKFKKECPTYREVGRYKAEWAEQIGAYLDLSNNKSPSFQYFVSALRERV